MTDLLNAPNTKVYVVVLGGNPTGDQVYYTADPEVFALIDDELPELEFETWASQFQKAGSMMDMFDRCASHNLSIVAEKWGFC